MPNALHRLGHAHNSEKRVKEKERVSKKEIERRR